MEADQCEESISVRKIGTLRSTTYKRAKALNCCSRFPDNGEVIVTLLPVNERFPWLTPARFRPELVPEELMAPVLTVRKREREGERIQRDVDGASAFRPQLTVEEYVQTMEKLTTDMRFTVYNICYKRILIIWIITAFTILLALLFSGFQVREGAGSWQISKKGGRKGSVFNCLLMQLL